VQDQAEAQMMLLLIPIIDGNSVGWVLRMQAIGIRATLGITITIENLIAQLPPPSYCLGTLTPTVPYGVALKLISEER